MKAICPDCGRVFDVSKNPRGAGYALEWEYVPTTCQELIRWLEKVIPPGTSMTEQHLEDLYMEQENKLSRNSFGARISELYAIGVLNATKNVMVPDKVHIRKTIAIPVYSLAPEIIKLLRERYWRIWRSMLCDIEKSQPNR